MKPKKILLNYDILISDQSERFLRILTTYEQIKDNR